MGRHFYWGIVRARGIAEKKSRGIVVGAAAI
jgi:hypothetical protein